MNTVSMRQFGTTLTDRADGKKAFEEILRTTTFPAILIMADLGQLQR